MARFLIDVNLPNRLALWRSPDFELVANHDETWPDAAVWDHARVNKLTIVTKDADFTDRIMTSNPPPKVIHLRIGNLPPSGVAGIFDTRLASTGRAFHPAQIADRACRTH